VQGAVQRVTPRKRYEWRRKVGRRGDGSRRRTWTWTSSGSGRGRRRRRVLSPASVAGLRALTTRVWPSQYQLDLAVDRAPL